jgi:membrane protein implicated in regulation of membrane protease activity
LKPKNKSNEIDFSVIDWSKVGLKKAEFIYGEAIARLDSIHKNNDGITNKAIGMLSFSLPILTALTGYFILQWGNMSVPLFFMSICSGVFLFAILVLLLLVLLPKGLNSAQGEPSAYFTDNFYSNSMEYILKGNILTLHRYINEDYAVQKLRANFFWVAVVLFAAFPIISAGVWAVASFVISGDLSISPVFSPELLPSQP